MQKIQLLFDGDIRGHKTIFDCVYSLNSEQLIWVNIEKIGQSEVVNLFQNDPESFDSYAMKCIESARCPLVTGENFSLHLVDGSIFAVEQNAIDEFYKDIEG